MMRTGFSFLYFFTTLFLYQGNAQHVKIKHSLGALNPSTLLYQSTGLRIIGKNENAILEADTTGSGSAMVTSFHWTLLTPTSSTAGLNADNTTIVNFKADISGYYFVTVTVNGSVSATDTIYAGTYVGYTDENSCICHYVMGQNSILNNYPLTEHATFFKRGVFGKVPGATMYTYAGCVACHTTGYNPASDNGNYAFLAKETGWDTTWARGGFTNKGDSTVWAVLTEKYPVLLPVAKIGCESCHGPASKHVVNGRKKAIEVNLNSEPCYICHDNTPTHAVGRSWASSNHAAMLKSSIAANNAECRPCHNTSAFIAYNKNKAMPDYSKVASMSSISCVACHDPHDGTTVNQLRLLAFDSLANGFRPPSNVGGKGRLCMTCHRGRENSRDRVEQQQKTWSDGFHPHRGSQTDMFWGSNAYDYDLVSDTLNSHQGIKNACVTCHMLGIAGAYVPKHDMKVGNSYNVLVNCKQCHSGRYSSIDDIKAGADYDGNGKIEGIRAEVTGLLGKLKAILPLGSDGEPIATTAEFVKDSTKLKSNPKLYAAIWNYYFVKNDGSLGLHNPKYTVAILTASLSSLTGIQMLNQEIPGSYELTQNYPNPFNPSTSINFGLPKSGNVKIRIVNMLGQEVQTLVRQNMPAGWHTVEWNAVGVASGVYFCVMEAGNIISTRKVVLMK